MTIDAIKEVVHAEPFRPFKLRLAGGPAITVTHPDYIAYGPKGRTVVVYREDDSFRILDTLLIAEIERLSRSTGKR
jgi:hypothetical protein